MEVYSGDKMYIFVSYAHADAKIIQVYRGIANNDIGITGTKNIKKKAA